MVSINNLSAGYGMNTVINELNLDLKPGMIHGLIGLNGSGKSTLLKCLSGILSPLSGTINFHDHILNGTAVGFLETEPFFYNGITGNEFLSLFVNHNKKQFLSEEWGRLFNVPLDELIDGYSTGMKKKLALIAVFKTNRKVLLLDEPFNGLDLESSRVLSNLLPQIIQQDKVIVITSHIIGTLQGICSEIHYLNNGKIQRTFLAGEENEIEKEVFDQLDLQMQKQINNLFL